MVDHLFIRDSITNGMQEGSLYKMRGVVSEVYDRPYRTDDEMNGEANDIDDFGSGDDEQVDSPFQQFNPRSTTRPSSLSPLTPHDESGFAGLDAPLN